MHGNFAIQKNIAVIGTGIAGMSAAWLLSQRHKVTVYESDRRIGGHSNTVMVEGAKGAIPVDTGFIVYNEATYPNLTALFEHLKVPTQLSDMSFAVSLDDGDLEYSGTNLAGLFRRKAQPVPAALLVDAARPAAVLSRGAARPARCSRNSTPRSATIWMPAPMARRSGAIICCRWRRRSGRRRRRRSSIIRPRPSSVSRTTTASCACATGRRGAPCSAAAAPMSSA